MKKRLLGVTLSLIIGAVLLIGGLYVLNIGPFEESTADAGTSIDEINKRSFDTEEMTTNLKSGEFIRAQFRIQLDEPQTLTELEKRDFQVKHVVLLALAEISADQLIGSEGIEELEEQIQTQLNQHLDSGRVEAVYTTTKVVQ
ncbi:flagellar basal body-associated protein FliL [Shouchella sp. JSM 1781072]|uniref:flagellar basal body-associated protein FliL n=1 Tax=Bacillaceae TaxID=186817 RepID=UPI000C0712CE|nr:MULTISPECIES: flagellar basal body-associated protein FliL [Bacillaceae]UTR04763.1 flagellar basal body-associated protein FliL [Alkalihalobacillus sp. LMS6]